MDSQLVVLLTTIITTTISALISGIFGIIGNQIQARAAKQSIPETPEILLPPGVELRRSFSKPRSFLQTFVMFVVGGLVIGVILGIALQRSQGTGNSQSRGALIQLALIMSVFVIIGIVILGVILSRAQKLGVRKWSLTVAVSVTLILVLTFSYFMLSAFLEERTVYFVVDTSAKAQNLSREILTRVDLGLEQIPDNVSVGLAVFGGSITGQSGCNDITELVQPAPKKESVPQVKQAISQLSNITPIGDGALQNSVIFALSRLAGQQGVQQIFVVTASLYTSCGLLDREFLDSLATQSETEYEIVVVHVGEISDVDVQTLTAYADRFVNISTTAELPNVIQDVFEIPPSLYQIYNQVYEPNLGP